MNAAAVAAVAAAAAAAAALQGSMDWQPCISGQPHPFVIQ
jgi:hypothetical protein